MESNEIINNFKKDFEYLMGFSPFEWQRDLFFQYFIGQNNNNIPNIPSFIDIPTGLGKTSVMTIWYLALKYGYIVPRRLIYVVDRRSVVDQATSIANEIRIKAQDELEEHKLLVSTLRGQYIDNRDWLANPANPSIIVGTVDMIGSRILFSGYGVSNKMRSYHAGLMGVDSLVVLDEAHLVPPFEKMLQTIVNNNMFEPSKKEICNFMPPFKLLSLSATGYESNENKEGVFQLTSKHCKDELVNKRLNACKSLIIEKTNDKEDVVSAITKYAWDLSQEMCDSRSTCRILIYCNLRKNAITIKDKIHKKINNEKKIHFVSELLVGSRRVLERQELSSWLSRHGFLKDNQESMKKIDIQRNEVEHQPQVAFLIATSAGEVGIDLDADHMICDLVEWERMVQRFGRVNRRGESKSCIKVIVNSKNGDLRLLNPLRFFTKKSQIYETKNEEWNHQELSISFNEKGVSPRNILKLKEYAKKDENIQNMIKDATTKSPLCPYLTRSLVDAWSMTSLHEHTGRPNDIQPWLRGWEEKSNAQTTIIWRKYLPICRGEQEATKKDIESFFEAAPPHISEKIETKTIEVVNWFIDQFNNNKCEYGTNNKNIIGYIFYSSMKLYEKIYTNDIRKEYKKDLIKKLSGNILILNSSYGGLSENGMLDATPNIPLQRVIDGDDEWMPNYDGPPTIRFRIQSSIGAKKIGLFKKTLSDNSKWIEGHRFNVEINQDAEVTHWLAIEKWCSDSQTEEDRSTGFPQLLEEHHVWTEKKARVLAKALHLPEIYTKMLMIAAKLHDEGKRYRYWQRAFNAPSDGEIYAKTKGPISLKRLNGYRHEFGSLPYAEENEELKSLPTELQDLALHLIAAHHGWGRPNISTSGNDSPPSVLEDRALNVALRFARLQKHWGPWGLAWWESLLRSADQQASRENDERSVDSIGEVS